MDYPFLMMLVQISGLGLLGGSAIALLRLFTIHFVQHDWTAGDSRTLQFLTGLQAAGLLLFAFSNGGHFAIGFFRTSDLPSLPVISVEVVLMAVLAASVVFLHVIVGPWLKEEDEDGSVVEGRPLVLGLGSHRLLAMTLAFAAFAAAWCLWLVAALPTDVPVFATQIFAALALMTLSIWALLALPMLALKVAAHYALRGEQSRPLPSRGEHGATQLVSAGRRTVPMLEDMPVHRIAHVPARRAPRPMLEPQEDYIND
jgi:hypothetical protein